MSSAASVASLWLRMRRARCSSTAPMRCVGWLTTGREAMVSRSLGATPTIDVVQLVDVTQTNCKGPRMPHLLHSDSSIQGERSISRRLTARAASNWRAAHPGGTVGYRDLGAHPLPHFDAESGLARMVAPDDRTPAQA